MNLPTDKQAGVCLHISSLPGQFGIGDIGLQAHEFIRSLRHMGMRVWQFLPLGPVGYGNSPYQPLSIFAGNEMLIGIDVLVLDGFLDVEETSPLNDLPHELTDYPTLIRLKTALLDTAAERFATRSSTEQRRAFKAFVAEHGDNWLHTYALYRVLKSMHGERAWSQWEPRYAQRDAEALDKIGQSAKGDLHKFKVQQFWFYRQWQQLRSVAREQGIALMGDVPIYMALDSADAWEHPELLEINREGQPDRVAGVPPDYFSADGQLWGNPVYDWSYHARTHYAWWVERIRTALDQVDMIRLDHFRGFESYWSVPANADTAREGEWREGPADRLFEVLQDNLGDLPLIAEDLGLITDDVRAFLGRWNFPGMKVLQFMVDDEHFSEQEIVYNSVCYTGTHDNDTTVGWFNGSSIESLSTDEIAHRQAVVLSNIGGQADTIHLDMIRFALHSQARLCMIPLQDILGLGSDARMNTPGTTDNNWRWRLGTTTASFDDALSQQIRKMISASGRST